MKLLLLILITYIFSEVCNPLPGEPTLKPIGKPQGIHKGRVTWAFDPEATSWDGKSDFFWSERFVDQDKVQIMLDNVIKNIGNGKSVKSAWDNIFKYFNKKHYNDNVGYKPGEKISIKLNLNQDGIWGYKNGNGNEVTPQFIKSLARHLVNEVGVAQEDIVFWDAARLIVPKFWEAPEGLSEEFPTIGFVDNQGGKPWVKAIEKDGNSHFIFSNSSLPDYDQTKVPTILSQAKYLIVVNAFRGHNLCGITATPKNFFGAIWRPNAVCELPFYKTNWCPADLHDFVDVNAYKMGTYCLLVDLIGNEYMYGGKGLIDLADGLYGGPSEIGEQRNFSEPCHFEMTPFNGHWSSSIFASLDPIALDSVIFDFLRSEPNIPYAKMPGWCIDNYMHEAALAHKPPSGAKYAPSGKRLDSLGVHEHWKDASSKKYSGNLGMKDGIELVRV